RQVAAPSPETEDLLGWPFLSELSAIEFGVRFLCGIGALLHEKRGFSSLDGQEFTAWLDAALPFPMLPWTRSSTFLRTCYLLPFAYQEGDPERPLLAAGAGARALLRILADYAGAISYDFRAGMAECALIPMYQTISKRSPDARFEFFSRVREIKAQAGKITEIKIGRQATTCHGKPYEPLLPIDRIECFPTRPRYEQLEQGTELQGSKELLPCGYDLESNWTEWRDVREDVLRVGEDFDVVILAIPPPAARCFTGDLARQSPAWADMLRHVTGVPTIAAQFWLTRTLPELGWTDERTGGKGPPLILGYVQPLAAAAEMSSVIAHEPWPPGEPKPQSLLYLCGPMLAPPGMPGCCEQSSAYIEASRAAALEQSLGWTERDLAYLLPRAAHADGAIKWSCFASPQPASGSARFDAQYFRANTTLSEQYITSFPGTIDHRWPAEPRDFKNLYLAGDWVKNNIDIGSLEGAILSGRMAARALLGLDYSLYGERDPMPWATG
ncbi:MAG TPA: FAD-dependent oxidoreductase, partial [Polyangiaceae bacterium]|nr:FAD-dependent oxidoreductase [Polyangiaceae bacterium]